MIVPARIVACFKVLWPAVNFGPGRTKPKTRILALLVERGAKMGDRMAFNLKEDLSRRIVAYILTSTSVAGRVSDARALARQLEPLDVFERVELVPAIFWNEEAAVARFLSEYPEHNFENA